METVEAADLPEDKPRWYKSELLWIGLITAVYFCAVTWVKASQAGSLYGVLMGDACWYFKAMMAWKAGTLGPEVYLHGAGMGVLGYFTIIGGNPFIFWALVYYVFTNLCFWLIVRRLLGLRLAILVFCVVVATLPATKFYVACFNNMTTYGLLLFVCLLCADRRPIHFWKAALMGMLFGICFAARYADPILTLPPVIYLLLRDFRTNRRDCLVAWGGFAITALPWLFFTLYMHHTYLGGMMQTPYATKVPFVERIGVGTEGLANHLNVHFFNDILRNSYQVFISPIPYAPESDIAGMKALLWTMPYLVFAIPALPLWWKNWNKRRGAVYSLLGSLILHLLFYGSFWAFTAHDLRYGCLRYMAGWYYLGAVAAVYLFTTLFVGWKEAGFRQRIWLPASLMICVLIFVFLFPTLDRIYLNMYAYSDKDKWVVSSNVPNTLSKAIHDDDRDTYWVTPKEMERGQGVMIDLGDVRRVGQVRFNNGDHAETSFPQKIIVYASDSAGGPLQAVPNVRSGRQNHIWILYFDGLECRRIVFNVLEPSQDQWLIYECDVLR